MHSLLGSPLDPSFVRADEEEAFRDESSNSNSALNANARHSAASATRPASTSFDRRDAVDAARDDDVDEGAETTIGVANETVGVTVGVDGVLGAGSSFAAANSRARKRQPSLPRGRSCRPRSSLASISPI